MKPKNSLAFSKFMSIMTLMLLFLVVFLYGCCGRAICPLYSN